MNSTQNSTNNTPSSNVDILKLQRLGELEGKTFAWIERDLNVSSPSTFLARWLWTIVFKRFHCLREFLYNVNLDHSAHLLTGIGASIDKTNENHVKIYNAAVKKFNFVAPRHPVNKLFLLRSHRAIRTETSSAQQNETPQIQPTTLLAPPPTLNTPTIPKPQPKPKNSSTTQTQKNEKLQTPSPILASPSIPTSQPQATMFFNPETPPKEERPTTPPSSAFTPLPSKAEKEKFDNPFAEIIEEGEERFKNNTLDLAFFKKMKEAMKKANSEGQISPDMLVNLNRKYDEIVKQIPVLAILRDLKEEIISPPKKTADCWESATPHFDKFEMFISFVLTESDESTFRSLQRASQSPEIWKKHWEIVREKMWNAWMECRAFLKEDKKITFITGSQSPALPIIKRVPEKAPSLCSKPALVPTGLLIQHKLVPLVGELNMGVLDNGVNQNKLSGMTFGGLSVCVDYSQAKSFTFNPDEERETVFGTKEDNLFLMISRLRIAVLRLLKMDEIDTEEVESMQAHIEALRDSQPESTPTTQDWKEYGGVIGHLFTPKAQPKSSDPLQRGQIVAVPIAGSNLPKYGVIQQIFPDGSCKVILEKDGFYMSVKKEDIQVIEPDFLGEETKNYPLLTERQIETIERKLKDMRERLEEIKDLFFNVRKGSFSNQSMVMIREPFPLIWASTTLKPELYSNGLQGEHVYEGVAAMGDDIQIVFTNSEKINTLEERVKEWGVKVFSFEAAFFIFGYQYQEKNYNSLWDM